MPRTYHVERPPGEAHDPESPVPFENPYEAPMSDSHRTTSEYDKLEFTTDLAICPPAVRTVVMVVSTWLERKSDADPWGWINRLKGAGQPRNLWWLDVTMRLLWRIRGCLDAGVLA
jgi:hypothetical protein